MNQKPALPPQSRYNDRSTPAETLSSLPSWIHEPESTLPGNGVALSFRRLFWPAGICDRILQDGARLSVGMDLPPRAHSLYKATPICAAQALRIRQLDMLRLSAALRSSVMFSLHCDRDLVAKLQQNRQQPQLQANNTDMTCLHSSHTCHKSPCGANDHKAVSTNRQHSSPTSPCSRATSKSTQLHSQGTYSDQHDSQGLGALTDSSMRFRKCLSMQSDCQGGYDAETSRACCSSACSSSITAFGSRQHSSQLLHTRRC